MRTQPALREACLFGAMLYAAFMVFWSSLIHLMESPAFDMGPRSVGLLAILGAAAALLSPFTGALADRVSPRRLTGFMLLFTAASFAVLYLGQYSLLVLAVGVLMMDVGVQMGHVSNQSRIFRLMPSAQSRIQTAYMFCYFCGAAVGSLAGTWAWSHYGWAGVCCCAVIFLCIGIFRFCGKAPAQSTGV